MPTLTITLPKLHAGQREVADSPARFKVLGCGRRWGKTRYATAEAEEKGLSGKRVWWVGPTFPMATIGWRLIKNLNRQIPGVTIRESERRVELPGGGFIEVKSADRPDSLRGEGLDLVILDECAFIKEDAWNHALRPALSDRRGGAIFISTPKGRNWFWRLYQRALQDDDWQAWQFPTSANPHIASDEIEDARRLLPEHVFAQEYLAHFVEDAGSVFRRVVDCATAEQRESAEDGHGYVFGVDWGKHLDFTCIAVVDSDDSSLVYLDRFNQIDYTLQVGRLKALAGKFKPTSIIAERNSMGEPLIEELQRDGLPVQPFTTTNASKGQAIDALSLAFERGDIRILADDVLIGELQAYEAQRLPSGMLRYGAPAGMHDDTVMALALAWQGVVGGSNFFEYLRQQYEAA